jgi:hypothetical protein
MAGFLLHTVLPLLVTFAVGAVGWFVTHWIANPILAINKLRASIIEEVTMSANVGPGSEVEELKAAQASLRRLAAQAAALAQSSGSVVRYYTRINRLDLGSASEGLIGLSNSLLDRSGSKAIHHDRLEKALRQPRTYTDAIIQQILDRMAQPHDR